jgi:hypothetical protein
MSPKPAAQMPKPAAKPRQWWLGTASTFNPAMLRPTPESFKGPDGRNESLERGYANGTFSGD